MKTSGIKTVVIIVLAIINVIFAGLIISKQVTTAAENSKMHENLADIFADNGININMSEISESSDAYIYHIERDSSMEIQFSAVIIGETELINRGGNIYEYVNDRGIATFRGSGEFTIEISSDDLLDYGNSNDETVEHVISNLQLDAEITYTDDELVIIQYIYDSMPVFNCTVNFYFEDGSLTYISGQRPTESIYPGSGTETEVLNNISILMSFLQYMINNDIKCSEIYSAEEGYYMSLIAGTGTLSPVWRIVTDNGEYFLDAVSGDVIRSTFISDE